MITETLKQQIEADYREWCRAGGYNQSVIPFMEATAERYELDIDELAEFLEPALRKTGAGETQRSAGTRNFQNV